MNASTLRTSTCCLVAAISASNFVHRAMTSAFSAFARS